MCHLQSEAIQMKMAFHALSSLAADSVKDFLGALDGWSVKEQEAKSFFSPIPILDGDGSKNQTFILLND